MEFRKYIMFVVLSAISISCEYDFPEDKAYSEKDLGEINTENVIAIGDGYLAGVMDGALYSQGQKNSITAIVNKQLNTIKTVPFVQADINSTNGFNLFLWGTGKFYGKWIYRYQNQSDIKPARVLTSGDAIQAYNGNKALLNDLTVPLLKIAEIDHLNFNENQFLTRVFDESNPDFIDQIVQKSPTLVFCWLGMNDFLDFATYGGMQPEKLTSTELFKRNFDGFISGLLKNTEAKIVLGNLISINDLPYFYFLPYNSLFLEDKELSETSARYAKFNQAVAQHNRTVPPALQRPFIDFYDNGASNLAPQRFVVVDNNLPPAFYPDGLPLENYRQLNKGELLLFNMTMEDIENGMGSVIPIKETSYLTGQQIELIENSLNSYNVVIEEFAANFSSRVKLVDLNSEIRKIAETGKTDAWGEPLSGEVFHFDGVPIEGNLDMNSIFSLDALHFNQRGNAFAANLFIQQINDELNANIPMTNINSFVGNTFSD